MQTRAIIIVAIALLTAACGTTRKDKEQAVRKKQAQIGMREIVDEINAGVQAAAAKINRETTDPGIKRLMLVWQIRTMEATQRSMQMPDLRWAFLDLWTMVYQSKAYLEQGQGAQISGPARLVAIDALGGLLTMMESRARRAVSKEEADQILGAAREWAKNNPIEDKAMNRPVRISPTSGSSSMIGTIASLPGEIFSLGGGVKDTAQAIDGVSQAADRAVDVVETLPITARWQTELLLIDLDQNATVNRVLGDLSRVTDTVVDLGKTVEAYPDQVEQMLAATIQKAESTQPEFRKTVTEMRATVDGVDGAILNVQGTLDKLDETGVWVDRSLANASEAGKAWEGAFGQLNLVVNPPKDPNEPPSEPSPPLDMKDIRDAAKYLTSAGQEIRGAVVAVRAVIEGEGIDQRRKQVDETTEATISKASLSAGELIDRLTWRAVIVILVFFGAMLGYRVLASRIPRRE
jgi:hypothetical protein